MCSRRRWRWRLWAAAVVMLSLTACQALTGLSSARRSPHYRLRDLVVPELDAALLYDQPIWNFHDGRLFSVFAHTFGREVAGQLRSLVDLKVYNNLYEPQHVRLRVSLPPYASEAVVNVTLEPGEERIVSLSPAFDFERLYALRSPVPGHAQLQIEQVATRDSFAFDAAPIIEPVTRMQWTLPTGDADAPVVDMRGLTPLLVTPDDRAGEVQKLVREAAPRTKRGSFQGYRKADNVDVKDQVRALYEALQRRGYIYNSVADTYFDQVQRVRLPAESLQQNHGNCVDTSLLFAAALEAVGLQPLPVFMTGHAFVGLMVNPEKHPGLVLFVESTAVSTRPFEEAVELGNATFNRVRAADPCFLEVDVRRARRRGMYPVNF